MFHVEQTTDLKHIFDVSFDHSVVSGIKADRLPSIDELVEAVTDNRRVWFKCGKGGLVCFFPNPRGTYDIHLAFKSGHRGPQARVATKTACRLFFESIDWLPRIEARFSKQRLDVYKFLREIGFVFIESGEFLVGMIERKNLCLG